jgi:DNA topoisomerase-1
MLPTSFVQSTQAALPSQRQAAGVTGKHRHARAEMPPGPESAADAGLSYVNDGEPGIHRVGRAPHSRYRADSGRLVRDKSTLTRIRGLAVPLALRRLDLRARQR